MIEVVIEEAEEVEECWCMACSLPAQAELHDCEVPESCFVCRLVHLYRTGDPIRASLAPAAPLAPPYDRPAGL